MGIPQLLEIILSVKYLLIAALHLSATWKQNVIPGYAFALMDENDDNVK